MGGKGEGKRGIFFKVSPMLWECTSRFLGGGSDGGGGGFFVL